MGSLQQPTFQGQIKDKYGNVDWDATMNQAQTERDKYGKSATRKNIRSLQKQKADDLYSSSRQATFLSSNANTANDAQVNTGGDINIGTSDAPDVTGGAGKRRKQGKGAMSATLGIT